MIETWGLTRETVEDSQLITYFCKIQSNAPLPFEPTSSAWSVPRGFPTRIWYAFLTSPIASILIASRNRIKPWSFSLCNSFSPPLSSYHTFPDVLFSIPFPNTLTWCCHLRVRDQAWKPYKTIPHNLQQINHTAECNLGTKMYKQIHSGGSCVRTKLKHGVRIKTILNKDRACSWSSLLCSILELVRNEWYS
jgi:hypothetical protein